MHKLLLHTEFLPVDGMLAAATHTQQTDRPTHAQTQFRVYDGGV